MQQTLSQWHTRWLIHTTFSRTHLSYTSGWLPLMYKSSLSHWLTLLHWHTDSLASVTQTHIDTQTHTTSSQKQHCTCKAFPYTWGIVIRIVFLIPRKIKHKLQLPFDHFFHFGERTNRDKRCFHFGLYYLQPLFWHCLWPRSVDSVKRTEIVYCRVTLCRSTHVHTTHIHQHTHAMRVLIDNVNSYVGKHLAQSIKLYNSELVQLVCYVWLTYGDVCVCVLFGVNCLCCVVHDLYVCVNRPSV